MDVGRRIRADECRAEASPENRGRVVERDARNAGTNRGGNGRDRSESVPGDGVTKTNKACRKRGPEFALDLVFHRMIVGGLARFSET
jgi:hypothetical protein